MDNLNKRISAGQEKIAVIGLGYVGLPLAVSFAKHVNVIGFDIDSNKIEKYTNGIDVTKEIGNEEIKNTKVIFSHNESDLKSSRFLIVSVPTPVNSNKIPDLAPVISASRMIGRNLQKGSIVVYESTVYPGVTEEICIPILEEESGLKCGVDFKIGYSPERINPGDKVNTLENIVKIVSGMDEESLEIIAKVYEIIIKAGVYRAESIKVAEAAKVIENSQRDINIAFMNELAMVFNKMDIDTNAVLKAAGTKWNFLDFKPGLVGGHCISIDPYYFIYKAEELGYHSQIILSGRKINDGMGKYVAENIIKKIVKSGKDLNNSKVAILGLAFKEDCPDVRNSKVFEIIHELKEYNVKTTVIDPLVDKKEIAQEYNIVIEDFENIFDMDAVVLAVPHLEFKNLSLEELNSLFESHNKLENKEKILIDVKGVLDKNKALDNNFIYWSL
ncbi:nucleotide sugar dehydrogenase [Planococcus beigongshangi]|uniref:nucleotide sugar dehydrogenase n=1 Tax=Planococcus beigongshangi TaxID=2782536 RepID=UPI00193C4086|nr:nucleotide sugar dehydrogenase [Planococcus beigongshangi]